MNEHYVVSEDGRLYKIRTKRKESQRVYIASIIPSRVKKRTLFNHYANTIHKHYADEMKKLYLKRIRKRLKTPKARNIMKRYTKVINAWTNDETKQKYNTMALDYYKKISKESYNNWINRHKSWIINENRTKIYVRPPAELDLFPDNVSTTSEDTEVDVPQSPHTPLPTQDSKIPVQTQADVQQFPEPTQPNPLYTALLPIKTPINKKSKLHYLKEIKRKYDAKELRGFTRQEIYYVDTSIALLEAGNKDYLSHFSYQYVKRYLNPIGSLLFNDIKEFTEREKFKIRALLINGSSEKLQPYIQRYEMHQLLKSTDTEGKLKGKIIQRLEELRGSSNENYMNTHQFDHGYPRITDETIFQRFFLYENLLRYLHDKQVPLQKKLNTNRDELKQLDRKSDDALRQVSTIPQKNPISPQTSTSDKEYRLIRKMDLKTLRTGSARSINFDILNYIMRDKEFKMFAPTIQITSADHKLAPSLIIEHEDLILMRPRQWLGSRIINALIKYFVHRHRGTIDRSYIVADYKISQHIFLDNDGVGCEEVDLTGDHIKSSILEGSIIAERNRKKAFRQNQIHKLFQNHSVGKSDSILPKADRVFFTVNVGNFHWILVELCVNAGILVIYDSLLHNPKGDEYADIVRRFKQYLIPVLKTNDLQVVYSLEDPKQDNFYDCGVFTLCNLLTRILGKTIQKNSYLPSKMSFYRKWFAYNLIRENAPHLLTL